MKPETLDALKGSILKWEKIVDGTGADESTNNCPLCKLFNFNAGCDGCPVFERTKRRFCCGTPYSLWARSTGSRAGFQAYADTPERIALAQAELDFLRSLLPAEAQS